MNTPDLIFEDFFGISFLLKIPKFFVADPDPGSCQPWIRNLGRKKMGSGIRDKHPDLQHWM
jgi:hypothetical protein